MVGSVLVQRMLEEGDFELIDPRFFSTSQAGGQAPAVGKPVSRVEDARDLEALATTDVLISCQGGDYTNEIYPQLRAGRLDGLLDRRRVHAAHGRRRGDRPRPGEPPGDRRGAGQRRQELHRRQLHRQPDADGHRRPVSRRPGRVDHGDDLPGGVGRRGAAHARAADADGPDARERRGAPRRPCVRDPRHRPHRRRTRCVRRTSPSSASAIRSPAACCPGSTRTWATARAAKNGRPRRKPTRSSGCGPDPRCRSTASASASAPCAATARR